MEITTPTATSPLKQESKSCSYSRDFLLGLRITGSTLSMPLFPDAPFAHHILNQKCFAVRDLGWRDRTNFGNDRSKYNFGVVNKTNGQFYDRTLSRPDWRSRKSSTSSEQLSSSSYGATCNRNCPGKGSTVQMTNGTFTYEIGNGTPATRRSSKVNLCGRYQAIQEEDEDIWWDEESNYFNNRRERKWIPARDDGIDNLPEWFSNGPQSRLDTVELRGFDDLDLVNDVVYNDLSYFNGSYENGFSSDAPNLKTKWFSNAHLPF